jgi:PTH1 family peptidyl-tRNA hydrolase
METDGVEVYDKHDSWVVAFLGNPGTEYAKTRHNAGWIIGDECYGNLEWSENKYAKAITSKLDLNYLKTSQQTQSGVAFREACPSPGVLLVKPLTFMNNSGYSIRYLCEKERVKRDNVIVVYDDIDIPVGQFKVSVGRGDGNHNGVKSVISQLGTRSFVRIRIGVGSVDRVPGLASFVLGRFRDDEFLVLKSIQPKIRACIETITTEGANRAMNTYNSVRRP